VCAVAPMPEKAPETADVPAESNTAGQINEQKTSIDTNKPSEEAGQKVSAAESETTRPQGRSVDSLLERLSIIKNHI